MTIPEPEPKNAKNKTDPPQGPTRRSTRLGTSAPAASRGVNGKGEASPPAEKPKAPRANQRATRNEGGEFLPEEEQDELLLRAEHGSNGATPLDRNAQGATQTQQLAVSAQYLLQLQRLLYRISALKEKAFEVWLSHTYIFRYIPPETLRAPFFTP